jgi:hypothetical protein
MVKRKDPRADQARRDRWAAAWNQMLTDTGLNGPELVEQCGWRRVQARRYADGQIPTPPHLRLLAEKANYSATTLLREAGYTAEAEATDGGGEVYRRFHKAYERVRRERRDAWLRAVEALADLAA